MKKDPSEVIRDAIETGYGGLNGDEYLAGKIVREGGKTHIRKVRTAVTVLVMLVVLTSVAFALKPRKYAVEDMGTWTYVDNQILYQGADEKRPTVVMEKEGVRNMVADPNSNTLYYITRAKGGGYTLESVSYYGMAMTPGRHISAKYRVIQDLVFDSALYMLSDTSTGYGEVYWVHPYSEDIPDSKLTVSGWENKDITSMAIWDDVLYAYSAKRQELSAIDLMSYSLVGKPLIVGELTAITAGFELEGEKYALGISGNELVAIGVSSGKKLVTGVELPEGSSALARTSHRVYVSDSAGVLTGSYDVTDLSGVEMRQLYIVDGFPGTTAYNYAEAMFKEKYPDVEIVHRWTSGAIDYKTEMMSGEPGIDIVCFQDYYAAFSPLPQLLKSGAIVDLTDEPGFPELRAQYRDIWELVSTNGRQYGVPDITHQMLNLWEVDHDVAAKIGWEVPEGVWTWDEFDHAMELMIAYNETAETPLKLLIDFGMPGYAATLYEAMHLDFYAGTNGYGSEEYLKLIQREHRMMEHDLQPDRNSSVETLDGNTLLRVCRIGASYIMGDKNFILPPVFDADDPVYVSSAMPLVVNANSRMKEEAIYFLYCFASVEATSKINPYYCGLWLKDESLYTTEVPSSTLQYSGPGANERNKALYNFVLEHAIPELRISDIWLMQIRELVPQMEEGKLTPEEYVAIMQRQGDMLIGE